jgi:hypothetical protein
MWLPKDERKVLNHYYKKLHVSGVETKGQIFLSEMETRLSGKDKRIRIKRVSKTLEKRDLLAFLNFQGDAVTVQLSLQGYDLGRKYNSLWSWSNLWYTEYVKNHWIWNIISFIIGIFVTMLVQWLTKVII